MYSPVKPLNTALFTKLLLQALFSFHFVWKVSMSVLVDGTGVQFAVISGLLVRFSTVSVVRWKDSQLVAVFLLFITLS